MAAAAEGVPETHREEPVRGMRSGWGRSVQWEAWGSGLRVRGARAHLAGAGSSEGRACVYACLSCPGD